MQTTTTDPTTEPTTEPQPIRLATTLAGPSGSWLVGNIPAFSRARLQFLEQTWREYGNLVRVPFAFGMNLYLINQLSMVGEILVTHADSMNKGRALQRTKATIGTGLLTSEGDFHKAQRKLIQPAFHHARIATYAVDMVELTQRAVESWTIGTEVDLEKEMNKLTLAIINQTMFHKDIRSEADRVRELVSAGIRSTSERINTPLFMDSLPTPANRKRAQQIHELRSLMQQIIHDRQQSPTDTGDLLSMLLSAANDDGSKMTETQLIDEILTLFIAGHETTANLLTWMLYAIGRDPHIESALRQEIDTVVGDRPATFADLAALNYVDWVVKESLRLYPPAWIFTRRTIESVKIGDYQFPESSTLLMSPWLMHRDEQYYSDPLVFRPERWANDFEKQLPRYAFIPFGGGPRVCIGNGFALMEAKLCLVTIMQRVRLQLTNTQVVEPEPLITLRPKDGVRVRVNAIEVNAIEV